MEAKEININNKDQELVDSLESRLGEFGKEMANDFLSLDKIGQLRITLLIAGKVAGLDCIEVEALRISTLKVSEAMPTDCEIMFSIILKMIRNLKI